ncbi:DUF1446 domain-containing protein [Aeoliella sp. ICT_H6.2]|uniref:DUF1446 domain-containing protein n=1 Tax=Aeoliella straminimaris TaxID=2954799 RepID=A0A9X2FDG8_9BACT|nr:acyclic terpene utilization AtuA family protein [Aeoliella straminimaris]MCO6043851.1 DUF1446 domain-containing protein [Aeoliella straminimaris]
MHLACLPHGSSSQTLRRVLAGVPDAGVLVLPASPAHRDGGQWLLEMMKEIRRELFLQPELQVLASVDPAAVERVTLELARALCESHCDATSVARVRSVANSTTIVEWLAAGETLADRTTGEELNDDAVLQAAYVELGAAPVVEASESSASIVVSAQLSPGSLVLAAAYEGLPLDAHDWDGLATAVTLGRMIEQPRHAAPLWLEVDDGGHAMLVALPTLAPEALDKLLELERNDLATGAANADVIVDLSNACWQSLELGHFELVGVKGSPPSGRYATELVYSLGDDEHQHLWPTSVAKTLVDWDSSVHPASGWLKRKR